MAEENRAFAREFLYKALEDAQSTIRSIDSKAGVGIVLLGAMLGKTLERDQLAAIRSGGISVWIAAALFALLATLAAILAFRTVFPMVNPAANISFPDNLSPAFFLTRLAPSHIGRLFSSSPRFAKLAETHESYVRSVTNASSEEIEHVLAAEVLKLSFIRQVKTDRLTAFARILVGAVFVFVLLVWGAPPRESSAPSGQTARCANGPSAESESSVVPFLLQCRKSR